MKWNDYNGWNKDKYFDIYIFLIFYKKFSMNR